LSEYSKYFISDGKDPRDGTKEGAEYAQFATRMTYLGGDRIKGAFHVGCSWYNKPPKKTFPAHTHDFDEVIGLYGSDPQNPRDLGGEIEFWMEDEKYIMTKSFLVFIPAGVKHCLKINRIDQPIFHFGSATAQIYTIKENR
jgi:hypothetical protein